MAVVTLLVLLAADGTGAQTCPLKDNDRVWIEGAIRRWQVVSRDSLRLKPAPLPWIVLFDETCVWQVNPDLSVMAPRLPADSTRMKLPAPPGAPEIYGFAHKGEITLPDGKKIPIQSPPQILASTSNYKNTSARGKGRKPFFVFSMPAVWRQALQLKEEMGFSVFIHEMAHTRQRNLMAKIGRLMNQGKLPEDFDDDIIQNRFGKREDFRKAYETERDLLYRAVAETDRPRKRELAKNVLDSMRERRGRFFSGEDAHHAEIESIFLMMEGVASWAAYRSVMVGGMNQADALKRVRGSGRFWVQDEGLALFLIIDALLPNWQPKTFADPPVSIVDLLTEAVERK